MGKQKQELSMNELLEQALVPEAEQPYKVPQNWIFVRLGSIITLISGRDVATDQCNDMQVGIPYILGASNLDNEMFKIERWIENPVVVSNAGDILLSVKGTIGKIYLQTEDEINISRQIMALRALENVQKGYLKCFLVAIAELLKESGNGLIPGISRRLIQNQTFPLPPLAEQQRIVDRIESLFAKLDQAKKLVQNALDSFANRKAAILHKAFSGELTANWREEHGIGIDSWKEKKLGKLIGNGPQNGLYKPRSAYGSGCLIVRIDNFYDGHIHPWRTLKKLNIEEAEINLYSLKNNDILINRVNSINYLGKSALVRNIEEPAVFESNVMRITLNNDVNAEYIIKYLNSNMGLAELRKNAKHAVNQASINQTDVKNTLIQIPSPDEQKEIVRILDCILGNEEKAKGMINVLGKINLIKKSILARAFRGELGTNDPSEENTRALLKKVLQKRK